MSKYPPLFQRIPVDQKSEGETIAQVQKEFELFWRSIQKKCPQNSEKTLAMRKMQEACMWFTRAIAINGFKPDSAPAVSQSTKEPNKDDLSDFKDQPSTSLLVASQSLAVEPKIRVIVKKKAPSKATS